MEKRCESVEMTREEKIESLNIWCVNHACDSEHCRIYDVCHQYPGSWDEQSDDVIDKVFDELWEGEDKVINYLKDEMKRQMVEEVKLTGDQTAKADAGKAEIRLVPMEIVWAIAWIRMYGNRKYGDPENWKTVEPERYRDAMMRHLLAYISDPKSVDEESGYPHLWHAACNLAFLMHFDYGDMCHYDFAVKKSEWEKTGKEAVENNHVSPSEEMRKLGDYLGDYFANELRKRIENVKDFGEETEA